MNAIITGTQYRKYEVSLFATYHNLFVINKNQNYEINYKHFIYFKVFQMKKKRHFLLL